jgi:hypothetical protein
MVEGKAENFGFVNGEEGQERLWHDIQAIHSSLINSGQLKRHTHGFEGGGKCTYLAWIV